MTKLPASFCPFHVSHEASAAYWITCSPHEWTWTQKEQEAMARAIVDSDKERNDMRMAIGNLLSVIKNENKEVSKELAMAYATAESQLTPEYISFFKL